MARIRTIKPEFFTSEDITSLTPLSRLFYASLWCESDREGLFEFKPGTLKNRYFPADECSIEEMTQELIERDMVKLYKVDGRVYGEVVRFSAHQVINNRETASKLPKSSEGEPYALNLTRERRVKDACVTPLQRKGREGKGKEELNTSAPAKKPEQSLDPLYHVVMKAMEDKKGEPFANYAQEGNNTKLLLKRVRTVEPVHTNEAMKAILETYYNLTQSGDKFWRGQPFTPSRLLAHLEAVMAEAKKATPKREELELLREVYGDEAVAEALGGGL